MMSDLTAKYGRVKDFVSKSDGGDERGRCRKYRIIVTDKVRVQADLIPLHPEDWEADPELMGVNTLLELSIWTDTHSMSGYYKGREIRMSFSSYETARDTFERSNLFRLLEAFGDMETGKSSDVNVDQLDPLASKNITEGEIDSLFNPDVGDHE